MCTLLVLWSMQLWPIKLGILYESTLSFTIEMCVVHFIVLKCKKASVGLDLILSLGVAHLLHTRSDLWLRGWPGYLATLDILE